VKPFIKWVKENLLIILDKSPVFWLVLNKTKNCSLVSNLSKKRKSKYNKEIMLENLLITKIREYYKKGTRKPITKIYNKNFSNNKKGLFQLINKCPEVLLGIKDDNKRGALLSQYLRKHYFANSNVVQICHFLGVNGYLKENVNYYSKVIQRKKVRAIGKPALPFRVLPYYWVERIGHFAFLDSLLKMRELGWIEKENLVLLAPKEKISNFTLLNLYKKYFKVVAQSQDEINYYSAFSRIPEDVFFGPFEKKPSVYSWWISEGMNVQQEWIKMGKKPLIMLKTSEIERGKRVLLKMGISKNDWFVCVHARSSAFHADKHDPNQEWRDSDISSFNKGIKEVIEKGGYVVRLGDNQQKPLKIRHRRIIDYALSKCKSDFMDILLISACKFMISGNSGLGTVKMLFGGASAAVNYIPLGNELFINDGCFLPKLIWCKNKKRYLRFSEMMAPPLGTTHSPFAFEGKRIRDNSQDEIKELILEMFERSNNAFQYSDYEKKLQDAFQNIRNENNVAYNAPMGRNFLKTYKKLLEKNKV
jgi:putative glycosyltransferase (TIGR04372 family)